MKTKKDFAKTEYDFEALKYATRVKVFKKDKTSFVVFVKDYWYSDEDTTDVVDGVIYTDNPQTDDDLKRCYVGDEVVYFPWPEYEKVEILSSSEEENHGSHPEVGFVTHKIEEIF
jgi:hypothetical protein